MTTFDSGRFAVISDIHGNVDALTAVLDDIAAQGVRSIVNLGDHLSGALAAAETADLLGAHDMRCIRGNHDRWLVQRARGDMGPIDRAAFDALDDGHLDWLRGLPATMLLADDIFACHGTPTSDTAYWIENVSPAGVVGMQSRADIAAQAQGIPASLFLCGHSHLPRRLDLPGNRVLLNPGSVGWPGYVDDYPVAHVVQTGTAAACYAVVEKTRLGWASAFRHVPYDPARMIAMARRSGLPDWESSLATGWVDAGAGTLA